MQSFNHFSIHAFNRVAQRTLLSCEEIARILDNGLFVNTGHKPGFNRNHLLFYSVPDDNFFIAIQDGVTGTVVTILPTEYQANLAWEVSDQDCEIAREILLNAPMNQPRELLRLAPKVFVISGHYLNDRGIQKSKVLLKTASSPHNNDIKTFLSENDLFSKLNEYAAQRGIDFRKMFSISIRLGNKGDPIVVDLHQDSYPDD